MNLGPIPGILLTLNSCVNLSSSPVGINTSPSGLFRSDAILLVVLFELMPIEMINPVSDIT